MTRICLVARCGRPAHQDLAICLGCCADLERHLGDVPALAAELDLQVSRQTASGGNGGTRSTTRPLAFDPAASAAAHRLRNVLSTWVRDLAENRQGALPVDTPAGMATWLLARIEVLRKHDAAEQICADLDGAMHAAWRAVDRRPDLLCMGPCGAKTMAGVCDEYLYAKPERVQVTCRCGAVQDVEHRRAWMRAYVDDLLMTAAEIARLACYFDEVDSVARAEKLIGAWATRARIQARGVNAKGRPTYQFGQVSDLLKAASTRRTREIDEATAVGP